MDMGPRGGDGADAVAGDLSMAWSEAELRQRRAELDDALANASYPEGQFSGRGIVICGGGDVFFPCTWVCCSMLRAVGCALPVELWYRGPREMTGETIALMAELGVTCVDAFAVAQKHPVRRLDGWELKAYAIAYCGFAEVLYLDADNMALHDPEILFASEMYCRHGAMFWPDRYSGPGTGQEWLKRETWELCGVPYRLEPEFESGQMLVDKRRCWRALALALHLNSHSDFYYAFFYGDKDTFHLAWRRAGLEFGQVERKPVTLGASQAIVQFGPEGQPFFQHRNGSKWKLHATNPAVRGFALERECLRMLAILRERWQGPMRRFPDELNSPERGWYEGLCAQRWFVYTLGGRGSRLLELREDFRIGHGAAEMELGWMVEADHLGNALLSLRNANAPTCFLRQERDAAWHGRWLVYDRDEVRLAAGPRQPGSERKGHCWL